MNPSHVLKRMLCIGLIGALILAGVSPAVGSTAFAEAPFDIPVPEFTAIKTDVSGAEVLSGTPKGLDIVKNAYYTDIRSAYGREQIVRLTALGILHTYGARQYRPGEAVTGHEALAMLVRLRGREDAVIRRVSDQSGASTTPAKSAELRNKEFLAEALTLGIVTSDEVLGLASPVTKERIAVWIGRALGKQPVYSQKTAFSYTDWDQVNPVYRALIEELSAEGIVPLKNDGRFGPKDSVGRGELAAILSEALKTRYAAEGIKTQMGLVIGVKPETVQTGSAAVQKNTVTVKNIDGTVTQFVSEVFPGTAGRKDYVTYKNGIISNNQNLALGDEVEYFTKGGVLFYVRAIEHDLVLEKLSAAMSADIYTTFHFGTVSEIKQKTRAVLGTRIETDIYRIVDISGDVFDIVVDEDLYTGRRDDIITYKGGKVAGVSLLEEGDVVEYLVNEKREVMYIKVAPLKSRALSGTVRRTAPLTKDAPAYMTIYGYDDRVYQLPLAPYANLRINDRTTELKNFVYGMPVTVDVSNGYIIVASGESYGSEPGYIPPYGKMRMGDVVRVYPSSFVMKLGNGQEETAEVSGGTLLTKDGTPVNLNALKVGESVKVYYDEIGGSMASKVEIEAPEVLFQIIYKGRLKNVNGSRGEIQLIGPDGISKPEFIANNDWVPAETYSVDLRFDEKTAFYVGDKKLTSQSLGRQYENYPVYAVVKSVYGRPTVVKLAVKTGGEMMYSGNIRTVDHTLGRFDISTKENFSITAGTIVIKDGLVVPSGQLTARDTVFVVSESPRGTYNQNAMVVKVVTPYDTIFDRIRIGAVETVNPSNITFRNHTQYTGNYLNAVDPNTSGYYKFYTHSKIVDLTDPEKPKAIKPSDFWHASYSRTENVDKAYSSSTRGLQFKRYYAFMVVNEADNAILAMHLRHKGLMPLQNIDDTLYKEEDVAKALNNTFAGAVLSRGVVTGNDATWKRMEITDSHDWTEYTGQWTANKANIFIKYSDAIIIKNNRVVSIDDLDAGDYVYVMRIKESALVIFAE